MPTVNSDTTDGQQSSGFNSSWDVVHDLANGQASPGISNAYWGFGVRAVYESGRGLYYITRSFFDFDTSGITGTLSSATLKIRSYQNTGPGLFIVKSGHDPSTTTDEWYSTWLTDQGITLSGWGSGDVTAYASEVDKNGVTAGAWITFTLNATALNDIKNNNDFKIVLMTDRDYNDSAPSGTSGEIFGLYYANSSGNEPYIEYTLAGAGAYGEDVIGVVSANIGKVIGVATANVGKVSGV